jgi:hypothetical protein
VCNVDSKWYGHKYHKLFKIVPQTAALLSHFALFFQKMYSISSLVLNLISLMLSFLSISSKISWRLMGPKCSAPKRIFVIFKSKITVVFNSKTCLSINIFYKVDWNYIRFKLVYGLFLKNVVHQFARAAL